MMRGSAQAIVGPGGTFLGLNEQVKGNCALIQWSDKIADLFLGRFILQSFSCGLKFEALVFCQRRTKATDVSRVISFSR